MTSNLLRYAIGLSLATLGVCLALQPRKLGRIGFGTGGAVPEEIPPLPKWVGVFIAAELLCVGTGILTWDVVVHTPSHSAEQFFTFIGAFLFLVTMSVTAIVAGLSARQLPAFTAKTASRVRSYRISAFVFAAFGITLLFLAFLLPLIRHG
jgi:F0F1-type ATP synthase membrane subunit c/vacuolar-type H+-ATPase subunit K